jgi:membrane fusion protein (multidrug efflux system)
MSHLFREEAVFHHAHDRAEGAVLALTPTWTRWTYWLLVGAVAAGIAWGVVGQVHEYAAGPALVRFDGRSDLTAQFGATVANVAVEPGQHVAAGEPLVQFHTDVESAELERVQQDFDSHVVMVLRDPLDQSARESLGTLRAQRDLAAARLEQRLVRAPRDGIVSDVRIRPGQHLDVGERLLSIVDEQASASLIVLLPGRYRPQLRRGMPLRFELDGYRYEYREASITSVGDEIVGAAEAKRFLGADVADSVEISEPVVLVRAALPTRQFSSGGRSFSYFDGLHARAQACVRSEPLLLRAFPVLRALVHREP